MTAVYILGFLAVVQGILTLLDGMRSTRHLRAFKPRTDWTPRVVVFCPCRGVDPEFRSNIASVLDQDYPSYQVVFIVDSEADAALPILRELGGSILIAGPATDCGQKVHNLAYAVERAPANAEVFAFVDSDGRYPRGWLRNLVGPLEDQSVGVTTGFRWYAAETGSLPALLRSVWNASALTTLGDHGRNFAWGGSMAAGREAFERMRVRDCWAGSVSDDYGMTRAARDAGKRIVFVPACLIPSYGDCSWRELLEFTTRQMLIVRVYSPGVWKFALATQTLHNLAFWSTFVAMWTRPPVFLLWLAIFALSGTKASVRYSAVKQILPEGSLSKHRWSYILLSSASALLYEYNLLRSAITRKLEWRQIRYNLISANRTEVLDSGRESSTR